MQQLLVILVGALAVFLLVRAFLSASPADLARVLRIAAGGTLLAGAVGLLAARRIELALPLGLLGAILLMRAGGGRGRPSGARHSQVRSAGLEMWLDHDSGTMDGRVLAGRHEGRLLSELAPRELREVAADFQGDPESLRLLEAYLDRADPGWREYVKADAGRSAGAAAGSGAMSPEEAYQILGLEPGASDADIRKAHRRLMKQVHPDRGGSAALAAKINEAKDRLLGKHG